LEGTNLMGINLQGAILEDTTMPDGGNFEDWNKSGWRNWNKGGRHKERNERTAEEDGENSGP
jgi:hypothetical protein